MLPEQLVRSAIRQAAVAGYDVLSVSGGEPLMYRGLERALGEARDAGLTTTITTNALILTERRLSRLATCVDIIAISLDGTPASHDLMRGDHRAFRTMASRLPALRQSGIPFGFVFTLTQWNVHELPWVAEFAEREGASLLQVHPLELAGFATTTLPDSAPDAVELLFAAVEILRLRTATSLFVQLDVTSRLDLLNRPDRFMVLPTPPAEPLGHWLTPLVLETDGTLVPITYGFPRRYALGSLFSAPFDELVARWDSTPLLELTSRTWRELTRDDGPKMLNWYETLTATARREPSTQLVG
jgi:Fe-coproporphyrin III synthase